MARAFWQAHRLRGFLGLCCGKEVSELRNGGRDEGILEEGRGSSGFFDAFLFGFGLVFGVSC